MAVAVALAAPAAAQAEETIYVDGDAIRYMGDDGVNWVSPGPSRDGEQSFLTAATPGVGCHADAPPGNNRTQVYCSTDGVNRAELSFGDGADDYNALAGYPMTLPVHADLGPGPDHFIDSAGDDYIELGPGLDWGGNGAGNDRVDGGPGDDGIGAFQSDAGNDTIVGGEGNDSLDGGPGNDSVEGGEGDDILHPSAGDDMFDGGAGDDVLGGKPADGPTLCEPGAGPDAQPGTPGGTDTLLAGPGNDQICAVDNVAVVDAGEGDDAISTLDAAPDGPIACGAGADALWSDAVDAVGVDCELQSQPELVLVPSPVEGGLPIRVPCTPGISCSGTATVFPTPGAAAPEPGIVPPLSAKKPTGRPLARRHFALKRHGSRTVKARLGRRAAKRLRKLGETRVEARVSFKQAGRRYVIRRAFGVRAR